MKRPLSHKGCPYNNAVTEAAFKIIKTEFVEGERVDIFMSTTRVDIEELSKRVEELETMIRESDNLLKNVNSIFESYMHDLSRVWDDPYEHALPADASLREAVMYEIKRDVPGIPRFMISVGEGAYLAAKATWKSYKLICPGKKKQKELLACYEELAVKNHLLIQAQQEVIMRLEHQKNRTNSEVKDLKKQLAAIEDIIGRIMAFKKNVEIPEEKS